MPSEAYLRRKRREEMGLVAPVTEKRCSKCQERKGRADFPPSTNVSDGLSSWCRACHREGTQAWRRANPEKVVAYRRAYAERVAKP